MLILVYRSIYVSLARILILWQARKSLLFYNSQNLETPFLVICENVFEMQVMKNVFTILFNLVSWDWAAFA